MGLKCISKFQFKMSVASKTRGANFILPIKQLLKTKRMEF